MREALRADRNITLDTAEGRVFVQVFSPPRRCFVIGAVHIAQPLVPMLVATDYKPIVIDPRGAWATEARFPGVELSTEWPDEALERFKPDRASAVVALTHDPKIDDPALVAALRSECFYIGALGSRRTHAKRLERLAAFGFGENELARIHAPIGLNIGAVSQAEIAVSILGEMTQILRRGNG
jgi:xanthine dehydrogenase accessory factor